VLRRLLLAFGFARLVAGTLVANFSIDTFVNGRAGGFELGGVAFDGVGRAPFGCEALARGAIAASAASATATTASAAFALVGRVSGRTRFEARRLLLLFLVAQHLGAHHLAGLRLLRRPLLTRLTRFARLARLALFALLASLAWLALLPRLALFARLARRTRLLLASLALGLAILATRLLLLAAGLAVLARLLL